MIGGTAYLGAKAGQRSAQNQAAEQQAADDQEARLEALEAQQAQPCRTGAGRRCAGRSGGGGDDVASQLVELKGLMDQGVLTQDEFNAAKAKLLA